MSTLAKPAKPLRFPGKTGPSGWAGDLGQAGQNNGSSSGFWKVLLPDTPLLQAILGWAGPFVTALRDPQDQNKTAWDSL